MTTATEVHQSKEDRQRNSGAVPFYYTEDALDPVTTGRLTPFIEQARKPMALPPASSATDYGV